ncbi:GDSL-type esterase/lipase family protein [Streptomyces sp. NBC_00424]|uniref:FG-GAP-like repeat-containing protein n=1 Tax=Streptomyces sp. NBC_00424 TaxID=2903648 RepID=UPI0022509226|nr:FG-GAP-like repeat-containing protein [Streptomyces sp. NBC_00424]MCX5078086.1 GDSL-type esterase/lipase family protein [Streptomyces sp. NBC_00424]
MRRSTSLALALTAGATAALGPGVTPAAAAPQPAAPLVRIMPLGDSITAGAGSSDGAGYRSRLWELMTGQSRYTADYVGSGSFGNTTDPDNEGHSGWTIGGIRDNIDRWQAAAAPDVVLLHLGINDLNSHNADPEGAAAELVSLIDRVHANKPGVTVIVQGLLPDTRGQYERTNAFNAAVRAAVAARSTTGRHLTYAEPPHLDTATELPDGLHPNDAGYRKMAAAYRQGLEQAVTDGWTRSAPALRAGTESGGTGRVRWADFDGDGRTDELTVADSGEVRARLNRGGPGAGTWQDIGRVATGVTADRTRVRFADHDGDGRADYLYVAPDGSVTAYLNRGGDIDGPNGWEGIGRIARGTTSTHQQVRFADFDGDGRTDYWRISDSGAVNVHLNRGGDTLGAGGWVDMGQIATGTTPDRARVRLADLDGDGRADYSTVNPNGSLTTYLNRGGDRHGGWYGAGQTASGVTTAHERVQLADVTADTHADYLVQEPDGPITVYAFNGGDPSPTGWTLLGRIPDGS